MYFDQEKLFIAAKFSISVVAVECLNVLRVNSEKLEMFWFMFDKSRINIE